MIELQNITKKYGNKTIFRDFNLTVKPGDAIAIIGASGSGKSTLLNIIGLIDNFDNGSYTFMNHQNVRPNSGLAQKLIREKISYLFQNFALIEEQTVTQNLLLALKYVKKSKKEKQAEIAKVLEKVGLVEFSNAKIYELSGGQQQRVAVARALIKPSELILADEPTGSLDINNRNEIIKLLLEINHQGKTIIIVTHDLEIASRFSKIVDLDKLPS